MRSKGASAERGSVEGTNQESDSLATIGCLEFTPMAIGGRISRDNFGVSHSMVTNSDLLT